MATEHLIDRNTLRTMVRGAYDLQKLRISTGNRIVANFRTRLGISPGEETPADAKKVFDELRVNYKLLTQGLANFPRAKTFKGNQVISTYTELCLIANYLDLEQQEEDQFRRLKHTLSQVPIYRDFLAHIRGIGPAMGGVLLSEFDIHKAKYVSSLWAYAGLDTVTSWKLKDIKTLRGTVPDSAIKKVPEYKPLHPMSYSEDGEEERLREPDSENVRFEPDTGVLMVEHTFKDFAFHAVYEQVNRKGRSARREHLVTREYIDKEGNPKTKLSLSYNPWLKTKLMGVLSTSFLRTGSEYRVYYDNYKQRLENKPDWAEETTAHKHQAALRYMVKMFLADLYREWRSREGLPVHGPYSHDKLGLDDHQQKRDDAA